MRFTVFTGRSMPTAAVFQSLPVTRAPQVYCTAAARQCRGRGGQGWIQGVGVFPLFSPRYQNFDAHPRDLDPITGRDAPSVTMLRTAVMGVILAIVL